MTKPPLKDLQAIAMPAHVEPMLCTLVDEPFDDPAWTFEPKLDGLRVICRCGASGIELISRRGNDQAISFPEIVDGLRKGVKRPAILDGEIVCLDEKGFSSFRLLQQRFHVTAEPEVKKRLAKYPSYLYVFDILYFDRFDLRQMKLSERREILERSIKWSDRIRLTESTPASGVKLYREMCRKSQEGIIAKRLDSSYDGGRSREWVKIKCIGRQEFVIGGFTEPQRSRVGLGALLVGFFDNGTFTYAGKVGTGYTNELLSDLRRKLGKIEQATSPFEAGKPPRARTHWVKPQLVAEIAFAEWTQNDMLRQPRFEGLRMDKKAKDVKRERAKSTQVQVHPKRVAK